MAIRFITAYVSPSPQSSLSLWERVRERGLLIAESLLIVASLLWSQTTIAGQKALVVGIKDYNYWSRLQN